MFKNKRKYQKDQFLKWINNKKAISKINFARKLSISRVTLDKLLIQINDNDFIKYKRNYANYKFSDEIRNNLYDRTTKFLIQINSHRKKSIFMPTFITLKPFIDNENIVSLRTYQNILKENNFYLLWCTRKTKKQINKRIKNSKKPIIHRVLLEELEEIKIQKKYMRKSFLFGDTVEIDACEHPWYGDEKAHLYRAVDAGSGMVLVEHVEKQETSMGYLVLIRKLLSMYGKPRLIVSDKRKTFWNGMNNKSQISLILNELDIQIITSSDPTSKPNVERSFLDSQQWLPLELFNNKIFTLSTFSKKIDQLTISHNKRFNKKQHTQSSFAPISQADIDKHLNLWMYRKVTNGNTISIHGEHYIPVKNDKRILFENNAKIKILSNEFIDLFVIWRGEKIKLNVLNEKYVADYSSKEWNKLSTILSSIKYWIFILFLTIIISVSFYYWIANGMDSWLNFNYKKDGLKLYIDSQILSIFRYIAYWCSVAYLCWRFIINLKYKITDDLFNLLFLIVAFATPFFFNPLVSSLWTFVVNDGVYYRVGFIVLVPFYISTIIFITKIKFLPKRLLNTVYISLTFTATLSIFIPFMSRSFMRENYSSYTGYAKGLPEVGEYINNHNLKNKRIAGDVDGVLAYVNNTLSFERRSKMFKEFSYSILTNELYNNIDAKQKEKIDILIKIKDKVNNNWDPIGHGFITIYLSNYEIFIK